MVTPDLFDEKVLRRLNSAARKAASLHRGYASEDDMRQEIYVWMLSHKDKVEGFIADDSWGILSKELYRAANRHGLKQRYLKDGTHPSDYFNYTHLIIAELLPEVMSSSIESGSVSDLNSKIRGKKPVNEGGDKSAMLADVKVAFRTLNEDDRNLLWQRYADGGVTEEVIGALMGIPQQTVSYQILRALKRMAAYLDGKRRTNEGRKAISNARAQVMTRQQDNG